MFTGPFDQPPHIQQPDGAHVRYLVLRMTCCLQQLGQSSILSTSRESLQGKCLTKVETLRISSESRATESVKFRPSQISLFLNACVCVCAFMHLHGKCLCRDPSEESHHIEFTEVALAQPDRLRHILRVLGCSASTPCAITNENHEAEQRPYNEAGKPNNGPNTTPPRCSCRFHVVSILTAVSCDTKPSSLDSYFLQCPDALFLSFSGRFLADGQPSNHI